MTIIQTWRRLSETDRGFEILMDKDFKVKLKITNGKGLMVESEITEDELYDVVKTFDQIRTLFAARRILDLEKGKLK